MTMSALNIDAKVLIIKNESKKCSSKTFWNG